MKTQHGTRGRMAIALVSGGIPLLAGLVLVPATFQSLGAAAFAWISVAWILLGNTGWVDLGLGRAVTQRIAAGDARSGGRALGTALLLQSAVGLGIAALALGAAYYAHTSIERAAELDLRLVACLLAGLIPALWANTLRAALEARLAFAASARVRVPVSLAQLAVPLAAWYAGLSLPVALLGLGLLKMLAACAYLRLLPHHADLRPEFRWRRSEAALLLGFGGASSISAIAGPLLGYAERGLLAGLGSAATLGVYAAVLEVLQRALVVPASMASVLFPSLSGSLDSDEDGRSERLLHGSLSALNLIIWPFLAAFWILTEPLLQVLLGVQPEANLIAASRWLALGVALNAFAHVPYSVVYAAGRPGLKARLDLIELPVYLLLSALAIQHAGLLGAAVVKAALAAVDLVALSALALRQLGGLQAQLPWKSLGRWFALAPAAAIGAWALALAQVGVGMSFTLTAISFVAAYLLSGADLSALTRRRESIPLPPVTPSTNPTA